MKKRDRGLITPYNTSLIVGSGNPQNAQLGFADCAQKGLFESCDAVPESTGSSNGRPTIQKVDDTSSAFYLKGEGTSKDKDEYSDSVISKEKPPKSIIDQNIFPPNANNDVIVFGPDKKKLRPTNQKRAEKWVKKNKAKWLEDKSGKNRKAIQLLKQPLGRSKYDQLRVGVILKDGKPLMPTTSSRARKWIKEGKAITKRTKTNIFYVQLVKEPSGRNRQPISLTLDPGSRYSGIAVCSKKQILYTCNIELIADEKKNRFASIKYRNDKRRELRRSRRYRNCRRRPARFDNRTKTGKMAPSIRSRKQLELKIIKDISDIYPISAAGVEDVAFNHYSKRWGKNFSQVEIGKKWQYEELKKIIPDVILIKGWDTNTRREQLKLKKSSKKEERDPSAHINDCIAMGSIILGLGIDTKTRLTLGENFDIITRPKYSRRKLHNEQVNPEDKRLKFKGHRIRKRFGGTISDWSKIRKGDYIEVSHRKKDQKRKSGYIPMVYRGWCGGFENDKHLISLYNFDWKVIGQFDIREARLLNRNHGLMVKSMEMEEIAHNLVRDGTKQSGIDDLW